MIKIMVFMGLIRIKSTNTLVPTGYERGICSTIPSEHWVNYSIGTKFSIPTGHFDKHCIAKSLTGFLGELFSLLCLDIHRYLQRKRMLSIQIQHYDRIWRLIIIIYIYYIYLRYCKYPWVYCYIWIDAKKIT